MHYFSSEMTTIFTPILYVLVSLAMAPIPLSAIQSSYSDDLPIHKVVFDKLNEGSFGATVNYYRVI